MIMTTNGVSTPSMYANSGLMVIYYLVILIILFIIELNILEVIKRIFLLPPWSHAVHVRIVKFIEWISFHVFNVAQAISVWQYTMQRPGDIGMAETMLDFAHG